MQGPGFEPWPPPKKVESYKYENIFFNDKIYQSSLYTRQTWTNKRKYKVKAPYIGGTPKRKPIKYQYKHHLTQCYHQNLSQIQTPYFLANDNKNIIQSPIVYGSP